MYEELREERKLLAAPGMRDLDRKYYMKNLQTDIISERAEDDDASSSSDGLKTNESLKEDFKEAQERADTSLRSS